MIISQVILIIVLNSYISNSIVTFQEFNTLGQCQYAAKLIKESASNIRSIQSIQCVNK